MAALESDCLGSDMALLLIRPSLWTNQLTFIYFNFLLFKMREFITGLLGGLKKITYVKLRTMPASEEMLSRCLLA